MQAETITVAIGGLYLGVRANDAGLTDRLRALLAPHVVHDVVAPPNISMALGLDEGATRGLHLLYRSAARELRTSSLGRLLRAVPAQLAGYLPPPAGLVRLNARALIGPDDAVLIDRRFDQFLERVEPRLLRHGYQRLDAPFTHVEPSTRSVVLPPAVALEPAAAAALEVEHPHDRREVRPRSGPIPVRTLLALVPGITANALATPSSSLTTVAPMVADRDRRIDATGLRLLATWLAQGRIDFRYSVTEGDLLAVAAG